ncbi:MAG: hypothetical protein ACI4RI_05245 [Ruminococcus sp.]
MMNEIELKLCDIQGRLFELSVDNNLDSTSFVKNFMLSETAKDLDSEYNRMQWAGEEYLLEEVTSKEDINQNNAEVVSKEIMYWIGYIYRYWHYYTGESSTKIYKQAPFKTMKRNYMMFHTMDPVLAIEDLKEIHKQ